MKARLFLGTSAPFTSGLPVRRRTQTGRSLYAIPCWRRKHFRRQLGPLSPELIGLTSLAYLDQHVTRGLSARVPRKFSDSIISIFSMQAE